MALSYEKRHLDILSYQGHPAGGQSIPVGSFLLLESDTGAAPESFLLLESDAGAQIDGLLLESN